ncbi:hypothetical protein EKE94_10885 [Mesobaculum littorinae]|uniref:Uncharacterized protein n=1 Tax=Mesobaculum littorinae TaxID=2486419 RepID=A0A438AH67_9RHOB|nr:hypothetical protein [Mesobaculum littorinae]RVV97965.1 hypothetical protein EKE94_10885 [Mesobaculum littorinae]
MKREDLARLKQIAEMRRDIDSRQVSALSAKIAGLQQDVDRMRLAIRDRQAETALDTARLAGADVEWLRATETRITKLQQQIARFAMEREARLDIARKSFGKAQAVEGLLDRAPRPKRD